MNKNKLNDIRIYLNELKLAFKNPRLYIANYFDELQNQIDVDYELFQQKVLGHKEDKFDQDLKNLIHSENSQQANETDEVILNRAREQLELMTDQVKQARLSCYTFLVYTKSFVFEQRNNIFVTGAACAATSRVLLLEMGKVLQTVIWLFDQNRGYFHK